MVLHRLSLALWLFLVLSGAVQAQRKPSLEVPKAQPFTPVASPDNIDADWRSNLCALLPQPCEDKSVQIFQNKSANPSGNAYVVIASLPLVMANVERIDNTWRLVKLNDFRNYQHSQAEKEGRKDAYMTLAPALYPLRPDQWAAAVLLTMTESYSGGGASLSVADFVALDPILKSPAVHAGIPFSCSRSIRACFSQKDYATSPNCHDETEGSLRISYGVSANSAAPYQWDYLWRETYWASFTRANAMKKSSQRFDDISAETVSWCGGPQE